MAEVVERHCICDDAFGNRSNTIMYRYKCISVDPPHQTDWRISIHQSFEVILWSAWWQGLLQHYLSAKLMSVLWDQFAVAGSRKGSSVSIHRGEAAGVEGHGG